MTAWSRRAEAISASCRYACSSLVKKTRYREVKRKKKKKKHPWEQYIDVPRDYSSPEQAAFLATCQGMSYLLSCVDSPGADTTICRFPKNTPLKETYEKNRDGRTSGHVRASSSVGAGLGSLRTTRRRTSQPATYMQKKSERSDRLRVFYEENARREDKVISHVEVQCTESKMLRVFEKAFGGGKKSSLRYGNRKSDIIANREKEKALVESMDFNTLFGHARYD
ncbi:hypothetical protein FVE85_0498 [Porphyridium purpureum]|uniref:Uncharacterized protein n=1 Tax=Porphyridium purpureum TaxID=35688 RepID=A0A5J4YYS7_PORPP|nr:hypothetical protein FVE85_0498 [Porphyridium purpureum]|eukprot:POR4956..scf208_2